MAQFSDLPVELIVKIMIYSAMPTTTAPAYISWKERSGSFKPAYHLALTNKKHHSAFQHQQRQIFRALARGILFAAGGCYDIALQLGTINVTARQSEPREMPMQVYLSVETFVPLQQQLGDGGVGGEEKYYAAVLRWLREHDIHQMLSAPRSTPGWVEPEPDFSRFVKAGRNGWDMDIMAVYPVLQPYFLELTSRKNGISTG
ncbi:hypothetical protein DL546_009154 [Coniochaeta pulveracea]|uniref:Uncharacterized protein n=1 Tax=Coniochaeta pulveracea TaxID=177199 RepID=A0A420YG92_9PEZI|nr:hypothetical protein DL546_009154 [Coniochaeta pulveracea]